MTAIIHVNDLPDYVIHNSVPQHQRATQVGLPTEGLDLDGMLEKIENGFIEQALLRARGNKTMAAELLRLNRTTLIERLRKKGMLQSARSAAVPPRLRRPGLRHLNIDRPANCLRENPVRAGAVGVASWQRKLTANSLAKER